jgi:hypothetical protein
MARILRIMFSCVKLFEIDHPNNGGQATGTYYIVEGPAPLGGVPFEFLDDALTEFRRRVRLARQPPKGSTNRAPDAFL